MGNQDIEYRQIDRFVNGHNRSIFISPVFFSVPGISSFDSKLVNDALPPTAYKDNSLTTGSYGYLLVSPETWGNTIELTDVRSYWTGEYRYINVIFYIILNI